MRNWWNDQILCWLPFSTHALHKQQARKAQRSKSETVTHPLTDPLTDRGTGRRYAIASKQVSTSNVQMNSYMWLNVINAQLAPRWEIISTYQTVTPPSWLCFRPLQTHYRVDLHLWNCGCTTHKGSGFSSKMCVEPNSLHKRIGGTRLCGASLCTSNYLPEYLDHSIQNIKIICSKSSPSDHVYRLQQGSGFEFEHKSEGACGGVTLCQFPWPLPVTGGRSKIKGLHSFWNPINLSFVAERHNFTIHTLLWHKLKVNAVSQTI